jgi:thymidylate kinase
MKKRNQRKAFFTLLPDGVGKEVRLEFRATVVEREKIKVLAASRQMPVSEYLRRTALSRPAPLDMDTELVLQLSDATRAIRDLHKAYLTIGCQPPEKVLLPVMRNLIAAILKVGDAR